MRNKRLKISALLLLGFGLTTLQAQTMYVKQTAGSQSSYELSSIQKLTFSDGNVTVLKYDNSSEVFALNGLSYLSFTDFMTSVEQPQIQLINEKLTTYPNPVTDVLNINLKEFESKDGIISLLSIDGKLLQKQNVEMQEIVQLNLCNLPRGVYLCRYSTKSEIKTVKIIKK